MLAETDSENEDPFIDGAVLAAARILPTWVDKDLPYIPSTEIRSACDIQHECQQLLDAFPTTLEEDIRILGISPFPLIYRGFQIYIRLSASSK